MARILVTNGEQRSSLAVVRALGSRGHHVVVCSADARALAAASRYCASFRHVPSPETDPRRYYAVLEWLVKWEGIDLVLPTTDVSAEFGLQLRERTGARVPFPTREAYEAATNKLRVLRIAAELGVPVPRQHVVRGPAEAGRAAAFAREVGYPVVLKPARSVVYDLLRVRRYEASVVDDPRALSAGLEALDAQAYPVLVQERIVGDGLGAFLLMRDGREIARFAHRRIRERPPTGGMSTYRESVGREDVLEYGARLLARLGWTGVAMVEFKEDGATGTPYLMEVNGRFWGSLQLAIDSGVNFPDLLVRSALGEPVAPVTTYREGIRSRWLMGDLDYLDWMLRTPPARSEAYPHLRNRARAVARVLVPWRAGDRLEILRLRDPGPFIRDAARSTRSLFRRARQKIRRGDAPRPRRAEGSARSLPAGLSALSSRGR